MKIYVTILTVGSAAILPWSIWMVRTIARRETLPVAFASWKKAAQTSVYDQDTSRLANLGFHSVKREAEDAQITVTRRCVREV